MLWKADGRTVSCTGRTDGSGVCRKMGFFLGNYIYLMDAYEDLPEDIEKGRYNPLKQNL